MAGTLEISTINMVSPNGLIEKNLTINDSGAPLFDGVEIAKTSSPTFTGDVVLPSTTSIGTVSSTEIGYLDGVTSAIQTQLGTKAPLASPTFTGTPSLPTGTIGVTQASSVKNTTLATTAYSNSLLAEYTVTGSAVTSIDFSGLDINTHKSYRVEVELSNATSTASSIYCFLNGDTTNANYQSQMIYAVGATIGATRVNTAEVAHMAGSGRIIVSLNIIQSNGYVKIISLASRYEGSSVDWTSNSTAKTASLTNMTQITLTSQTASSIGVGSKVRIFRGDV